MKKAVIQSFNTQAHFLRDKIPTDIKPQYSPEELQHSLIGGTLLPSGWLQTADEKLVLPSSTKWKVPKLHIWKLKIPLAKSIFKGK